jgi:hypothetical protein
VRSRADARLAGFSCYAAPRLCNDENASVVLQEDGCHHVGDVFAGIDAAFHA